MAFNNHYPKRKDWLGCYYKSARFDRSCRTGGSCPWCIGTRTFNARRKEYTAKEKLHEPIQPR